MKKKKKIPFLIILSGLQGTGKSTVAKKISNKLNTEVLSTDSIREELFEVPDYQKEIYSKLDIQKVYSEMFFRAEDFINKNKNVILDATFSDENNREKAKKIHENYLIIEIICPEEIVKKRLDEKEDSKSKSKFEHYLKYKKFFNPIKEKHEVIDTSKNIDKQINKVLKKLGIE